MGEVMKVALRFRSACECVEVAPIARLVLVRDSTDPDSPVLAVTLVAAELHIGDEYGRCAAPVQARRPEVPASPSGGRDSGVVTAIIAAVGGIVEALVAGVIAIWSGGGQ